MFFHILKKDLMKKKGVNIILFLFIMLATVFVASSMNNIIVVKNATDYTLRKGKVPDDSVWLGNRQSVDAMDKWMRGKGKDCYTSFSKNESISVKAENIKSFRGKNGSHYKILNSIQIQSVWKDYFKIYTQKEEPVTIKPGKITMQKEEYERNHLKTGDTIVLTFDGYEKKFTCMEPVKDPGFGGNFLGTTRYFISEQDYQDITKHTQAQCYIYNVKTDNVEHFKKMINRQSLNIMVQIDRDLFALTYVISFISAAVLMIVSVCLIIIAFLVLRFTISITLTEDYKEIGIMKAIGIRDIRIKWIYLLKYISITVVAAILGCLLSVPFSELLLRSVATKLMRQSSSTYFILNVLGAIAVLLIVLAFCYYSTSRLKRFSAVEAIRGGGTGESYRRSSRLSLHKKKRLPVTQFLAVNDILSKPTKYVVMILTFAIGMMLITLCTNIINTFHSKEMAKNFLLDTSAQAYLAPAQISYKGEESIDQKVIQKKIRTVETELQKKGYDASISTISLFSSMVYKKNAKKDAKTYTALQPVGCDGSYIDLLEGDIPRLKNEVVVSEKILQENNWVIGDHIMVSVNGKTYRMLICGSYQNYMQMGKTILLSEKLKAGPIMDTGCWYYQISVKNADDYEDVIAALNKDFKQYKFLNALSAMGEQLGGTMDMIAMLKQMILVLVCGLSVLITVLMMKIFVVNERGEIAMLRSIGFSLAAVRRRQILRMVLVGIIGALTGILLSTPLNYLLIRPVFGMMGATHIGIQVNIAECYLLNPLVLILCVIAAAYFSTGRIRRMNLMDIQNVE